MTDYRVKKDRQLIDYLTDLGYTRTKVRQLMKHRAVAVNGKTAPSIDYLLNAGDSVSVSKGSISSKALPTLGIKIVFEDDELIVIDKPAGLLTS